MNFEISQTQEKKEFFYPKIEYRREPALELFSKLLKEEDKELLELVNKNDRETLQWLTMTFDHPERNYSVFLNIKENKEHIDNPQDTRNKLFNILEKHKNDFLQDNNFESDISEYSERMKKLIEYFKPIDLESRVQNVIKVYADNIVDNPQQCWAIKINKDAFMLSHSQNQDNFDHEFIHIFINPIVDKLSEQFSEIDKEKLKKMIHPKLLEQYGGDFKSALCEVIIRVYGDDFKRDEEKYAGKFTYELGNRVYTLYQKYSNQEKDKEVDFETFLLNNKDVLLN
ncbi:MAG: hypothetical protein PHH83_01590 [Patescibacteria group bacterium]|nr:hypothetical protein [Patescibacteria group bacterium]